MGFFTNPEKATNAFFKNPEKVVNNDVQNLSKVLFGITEKWEGGYKKQETREKYPEIENLANQYGIKFKDDKPHLGCEDSNLQNINLDQLNKILNLINQFEDTTPREFKNQFSNFDAPEKNAFSYICKTNSLKRIIDMSGCTAEQQITNPHTSDLLTDSENLSATISLATTDETNNTNLLGEKPPEYSEYQ